MPAKRWWRARLRWAVLEQGYGLYQWRECECWVRALSREAAFQLALRLGRQQEWLGGGEDGIPWTRTCLAAIVYLEEEDPQAIAFSVSLGVRRARERIPFDHDFRPQDGDPPPMF